MSETKIKGVSHKRNKDHDDFVRGLFSYTEFVYKILQYSLPADLKPYIDFSTLRKSSETHVDELLQITYSDTVYLADLNKSAIPQSIRGRRKLPHFQFGFMGEFKSGIPDLPVDFQIDDYVRSIQVKEIKNGHPPSIVIPILIYHGAKPWRYKRLRDYFAKYLPSVILGYIPYPKYIVIDLQAMSDADIAAALDLEELRAAFIALKHAHDKEFFQHNLEEILKFAATSKPSLLFQTYLRMLLEYSERRSKLENKEFKEIVELLNPDKEMATKYKSFIDVAEEEAMERGMKKGMEKGMEKGISIGEANANQKVLDTIRQTVIRLIKTTRWENIQIAEVVDVSTTFVETIRLELSMGKV
jgi:hypothetical protein